MPEKECSRCSMGGHTKKSCRVGRVTCEDDVMVNAILITPVEDNTVIAENEVIVDAGGDTEEHTEEENNDENDDEDDDEDDDGAIDEVECNEELFNAMTEQFEILMENASYENDTDD